MPAALNLPPRPCAQCGNEFTPAHSRAKYCSKPCLWKSKNDRYRAANPEKARAHTRAMYAKHREKRLEYMRVRAKTEKHRATVRAINDRYRETRPWFTLIYSAQKRAKQLGLPFDLTQEWAESIWTGKCAVTGLPFRRWIRGKNPGPRNFSASIDRIKASRGYVQGNCRFVIFAVNALKGDGDDEEMFCIAEAILRNHMHLKSITADSSN